jgi:hypothetical protein
MKPLTLVTKHLYFGLDPERLREAANRVLARVPSDTGRAVVRLDAIVEDFRLSAAASRAVLDEMVADGILEPLAATGVQYVVTPRFREIAEARIVDPLPRPQAQMLLTHCAEIAARFNRTANRNKYEIEAIAVFGGYMSRRDDLAELSLGITGRRRVPRERPLLGRATALTEGSDAIRTMFERQSSFIELKFCRNVQEIPRPFAVIFRADD